MHRLPHKKRGSVYAYKSELDAWWSRGTVRFESPTPTTKAPWRYRVAGLIGVLALSGFTLWRAPAPPSRAALRAIPVTSYLGREFHPSFSPDGRSLAFAWDGEGRDNFDVYSVAIGSSKPLRLTTSPAMDFSPVWSPDGSFIAFIRPLSPAKVGIFLVPALGGVERLVAETWTVPMPTAYTGPQLAWTPQGNWIVAAERPADEPQGLFLVSSESGAKRRLTANLEDLSTDRGPAVSPDGRWLAFARGTVNLSRIFVIALDPSLRPVGDPRPLTVDDRVSASPVWSLDGRWLIFTSGDGQSDRGLWRVPFTAKGARPVSPERLAGIGEDSYDLAISQSGGRLAYTRRLEDVNIWKVDLAGTDGPRQWIASSLMDSSPEISPDGQRVVFSSNRSGTSEIWVCARDGSNAVKLTRMGGAINPHWSPDGTQVAFDVRAKGLRNLFVMAANGGDPRQLSQQGIAMSSGWSRDGEWLYYTSLPARDPRVWKLPVAGGNAMKVTKNLGAQGFESPDGFVYYVQHHATIGASLWRVPVNGGEERQILDEMVQPNSFAVARSGIYFLAAPARAVSEIRHFSIASGEVRRLGAVTARTSWGLSVAPGEGWLLYSQYDTDGSDVMRVENFH